MRRISTFCMGDAFRSSLFSTVTTVWLSSFDSCCCSVGGGALGSDLYSKLLSLAAMEIDVEIGDVAMDAGIGDGSFTSMTVTKLVGVSDRVGDATDFASSVVNEMPLISAAFRRCDVNSSIH